MTGSQGGSQSDSPGGKVSETVFKSYQTLSLVMSLALIDAFGDQKSSGPTAIRPVNVHQINTADQDHPQADFMIDGTEVTQVRVLAFPRTTRLGEGEAFTGIETDVAQENRSVWSRAFDT